MCKRATLCLLQKLSHCLTSMSAVHTRKTIIDELCVLNVLHMCTDHAVRTIPMRIYHTSTVDASICHCIHTFDVADRRWWMLSSEAGLPVEI